jgi:hypothetical protein
MLRLESSDLGRVVLSTVIVVILVSLIAFAAPDSAPQRTVLRPATPLLVATGLGQGWGMFAPDPRHELLRMTADVHNADGSTYHFKLPFEGPFAAASDYRWRKWLEWAFLDEKPIIEGTAIYAAHRSAAAGHKPVSVTVTRSLARLRPPGQDGPLKWHTSRAEVHFKREIGP